MNLRRYNRSAWDRNVANGNRWTIPVGPETIASARSGSWQIVLTPSKPVPHDWFPQNPDVEVLCLAGGGGQQGPVLAAAGMKVTVLDNSPRQLEQDRAVADRDNLRLTTVEGDMADLSMFADASFGLIVHPISNCFVPDVRAVWREAFRVLQPKGALLAGFLNPLRFLFDDAKLERGEFEVRHALPYSDLASIGDAERQRYIDKNEPLCFGHLLADQIGGQLDAGFVLTGFYEDSDPTDPLAKFTPSSIATRSCKPG